MNKIRLVKHDATSSDFDTLTIDDTLVFTAIDPGLYLLRGRLAFHFSFDGGLQFNLEPGADVALPPLVFADALLANSSSAQLTSAVALDGNRKQVCLDVSESYVLDTTEQEDFAGDEVNATIFIAVFEFETSLNVFNGGADRSFGIYWSGMNAYADVSLKENSWLELTRLGPTTSTGGG